MHWALVLLHGSARRSSTASRRKVSLLTHPSSSQLGTLACAAVCAVSRFAHALKRPLPTRTLADITACERGGGRSLRNIKVTEKRADWRDLTPPEMSSVCVCACGRVVGACDDVQLSSHVISSSDGRRARSLGRVRAVEQWTFGGFKRFQAVSRVTGGGLGGQFCKVCAIRKISASCVGQC